MYAPEGFLIDTPRNQAALKSISALQEAMVQGRILEARAVICDSEHNLFVDLGFCRGKIPRIETVVGLNDGSTRDIAIISRVNKPVCFVVTGFEQGAGGEVLPILSRRAVQVECAGEYISSLCPGDIIDVRITHLESFGCFVDIGCGITSLIPIDAISVSRISHPSDRFRVGQDLKAVVRGVDQNGRVTLSHKELLGTWDENASGFKIGETVAGIVRSVESYGVFVELTPNLAGLAEPKEGVCPGMQASVFIKNINREKMKIKLILIDAFDAEYLPPKPNYYISEGRLSRWRYSPGDADRVIEAVFDN
ncbi:MAG: S1 RNA-binding domain-containing protein [Oscillospiraceae bacterium]|nr:S1 RNA-binding domain-containing protein [Oscillospiraceae bacterium]